MLGCIMCLIPISLTIMCVGAMIIYETFKYERQLKIKSSFKNYFCRIIQNSATQKYFEKLNPVWIIRGYGIFLMIPYLNILFLAIFLLASEIK